MNFLTEEDAIAEGDAGSSLVLTGAAVCWNVLK
jgi:hypothetical protein